MRYNISLNRWNFSIDSHNYRINVTVPHTWNVNDKVLVHKGETKYETTVFVDKTLAGKKAFLYFGAVYHTAKVSINGIFAGVHTRSGYTPFQIDVTDKMRFGESNKIEVEVDNTHIKEMLPYDCDFDWADDGGIIRKAELRFMEQDAAEYLHVEERIEHINNGLCSGQLIIKTAFLDGKPKNGAVRIIDCSSGKAVIEKKFEHIGGKVSIDFEDLRLWSCFSPNLYRVSLETENDFIDVRIGLRKIEISGEKILLNGEPIYLRGCEWMPGSHPDFGMAEPLEHSIKCLRQLKDAGCIFTRFHWQQDDAIYDWCDENGLLVQEEIPYWGNPKEASPLQYEIAKQQADEMVYWHKNHPSIIFWGVGNELGSEGAIPYVDEMVAYFKSLDSRRLVNYVSNSLGYSGNDDATLHGDVVMWNEYLGTWEPTDDIVAHALRTAKKCEGRPLLITEFGLCEPQFGGGDERRSEILRQRLQDIYPQISNICGYVWFSLNDYRTHMGEEGEGKMKRRVHGSTDMYGNEKPSYRILCELQNK